MQDIDQSWDRMLTSKQSEFIHSFLAENAPQYQRLIAPVGSGRTIITALITQALVQRKGAKKILFLLPGRVLIEQYKATLKKLDLDLPIEYVDLRKFRELLTNVSLGASPWPSKVLALLHIDVAKSPEILEAILNIEWDLIVSDSVSYRGDRSKVLGLLLEKKNSKRLLILEDLGHSPQKGEAEDRSHGITTTRWTINLKQIAESADITFQLRVIDYERSHEEVEFIKSYINLAEQTKYRSLKQSDRIRLASSSLYAAEQSLRRIRNKYAHQSTLSFLDGMDTNVFEDDLAEEFSIIQPQEKRGEDPTQVFMEIQSLLDTLNRVTTDSKFDAFMSYIQNECQGSHVLVHSDYLATITYLSSILKDERDDVYQIMGPLTKGDIHSTLNRFNGEGGVLLATTALLIEVDLKLDELIFYDTPNYPTLISQSIARLFRYRQSDSQGKIPVRKKVVAFRDKSQVIPTEGKWLQQLQKIVRQLSR